MSNLLSHSNFTIKGTLLPSGGVPAEVGEVVLEPRVDLAQAELSLLRGRVDY